MLILADMHKDYMETVKKEAILMILHNRDEFLKREKLVARLREVPDLYFEVFARAVSDRSRVTSDKNALIEDLQRFKSSLNGLLGF